MLWENISTNEIDTYKVLFGRTEVQTDGQTDGRTRKQQIGVLHEDCNTMLLGMHQGGDSLGNGYWKIVNRKPLGLTDIIRNNQYH